MNFNSQNTAATPVKGSEKMAWRNFYEDVRPFTAMIAAECTNVGLNILFKAATLKGMSYQVFIVYSYAIATLILLFPVLFVFCRSSASVLPSMKFPLLSRICLLAAIGFFAQLASYKGIACSSPTLASAMRNLTPAFTFIFAVILRMEKLALRRPGTQAKIIGTVVSISGALVVALYRGPRIFSAQSVKPTLGILAHWPLDSSNTDWLVGCILLATEYILLSVCYILQAQILQIFPMELIVTFFYTLFLTIISAPVCLVLERNMDAWLLRPDIDIALAAILYSGFFGSFFSTIVHSWGLRLKGPVYVTSFRPLSIAIAAIMGVILLGDPLHLGSFIGAIIICLGFYAVLWGKAKEDGIIEKNSEGYSIPPSSRKVPLLQSSTEDISSQQNLFMLKFSRKN